MSGFPPPGGLGGLGPGGLGGLGGGRLVPGQPNSETVGPNHPVFHPEGYNDQGNPRDPGVRLPPGAVPPGASYDPIGPPALGNQWAGPNNDHLPPPK